MSKVCISLKFLTLHHVVSITSCTLEWLIKSCLCSKRSAQIWQSCVVVPVVSIMSANEIIGWAKRVKMTRFLCTTTGSYLAPIGLLENKSFVSAADGNNSTKFAFSLLNAAIWSLCLTICEHNSSRSDIASVHKAHTNGGGSGYSFLLEACTQRTCSRNTIFWLKFFSHSGHLWGRSPVWMRWCFRRVPASRNDLSQ